MRKTNNAPGSGLSGGIWSGQIPYQNTPHHQILPQTAACHCPQSQHNKNHKQLVLFSWLIVSEGLFKSDRLDNYVMIPGRPTVHHSCQASVCWRLRRDKTSWWEQRGWHYSFFLFLATRWCWSECVWCGGKVTTCQMTSLRSLETPETGTGRDGWHKIETNTELSTLIKV